MRISALFILAVLAFALVACASEPVVVAPKETPVAADTGPDPAAAELERTFDEGFEADSGSVSDGVNPDDFIY